MAAASSFQVFCYLILTSPPNLQQNHVMENCPWRFLKRCHEVQEALKEHLLPINVFPDTISLHLRFSVTLGFKSDLSILPGKKSVTDLLFWLAGMKKKSIHSLGIYF